MIFSEFEALEYTPKKYKKLYSGHYGKKEEKE
jgi:hypothetical protein